MNAAIKLKNCSQLIYFTRLQISKNEKIILPLTSRCHKKKSHTFGKKHKLKVYSKKSQKIFKYNRNEVKAKCNTLSKS
jgi:adenylate kinase family enzyme